MVLVGRLVGKRPLVILKCISEKRRQVASSGDQGNKPSASIKCREFLEDLENFYIVQKECAAWS